MDETILSLGEDNWKSVLLHDHSTVLAMGYTAQSLLSSCTHFSFQVVCSNPGKFCAFMAELPNVAMSKSR